MDDDTARGAGGRAAPTVSTPAAALEQLLDLLARRVAARIAAGGPAAGAAPGRRATMLSRGNSKLGRPVWTFSLPSVATCPGRSPVCERLCYADACERRGRPSARRYARNLDLSHAPGFATAVTDFIRRRRVRVVRVHVGGDFYDARRTPAPGWA